MVRRYVHSEPTSRLAIWARRVAGFAFLAAFLAVIIVRSGLLEIQPALATFFGKLTTGQVIELVAGLFAMLQPLPAAPVATRDAVTDLNNLILYQGAIAQHAKRDEQVRTLGGLVGKVLG